MKEIIQPFHGWKNDLKAQWLPNSIEIVPKYQQGAEEQHVID